MAVAVVEVTLCLPFKPAEQAITEWKQKVVEACERTRFLHQPEASAVLSAMADRMVPLMYAQLIESITVGFGLAEVHFSLRYDAQPDDEDEMDIATLDLVLDPPGECAITLLVGDMEKAEFLGCRDLEQCSTEHVRVVLASLPGEGQKEEDSGSVG